MISLSLSLSLSLPSSLSPFVIPLCLSPLTCSPMLPESPWAPWDPLAPFGPMSPGAPWSPWSPNSPYQWTTVSIIINSNVICVDILGIINNVMKIKWSIVHTCCPCCPGWPGSPRRPCGPYKTSKYKHHCYTQRQRNVISIAKEVDGWLVGKLGNEQYEDFLKRFVATYRCSDVATFAR